MGVHLVEDLDGGFEDGGHLVDGRVVHFEDVLWLGGRDDGVRDEAGLTLVGGLDTDGGGSGGQSGLQQQGDE